MYIQSALSCDLMLIELIINLLSSTLDIVSQLFYFFTISFDALSGLLSLSTIDFNIQPGLLSLYSVIVDLTTEVIAHFVEPSDIPPGVIIVTTEVEITIEYLPNPSPNL